MTEVNHEVGKMKTYLNPVKFSSFYDFGLHLNHLKKHLANINVKIIYFQSMFNRQVLTSTDSLRFFARIERKKVRIMMSSDVNFPLKTYFPPWFCRIPTQANLILIYIFIGKLSYSRDFLISLANCAESRKKPEFLPEYSIVLTKAVSLESALFKMIVQLY